MFWKHCFFKTNRIGIWSSLYYQERWYFLPKIWSYSLHWKWNTIFLKRHMDIWYFLYTAKDGILQYYPFVKKKIHKKYDDLLPKKNTPKDDISGIIKKVIFVLGNMVFLLIESLKMIKELSFMKRFQWCFVLFT